MVKTIAEFVKVTRKMTKDEIYDLIEMELSDDMRDKIYELADPECPEPCRCALRKLGKEHNSPALLNY